MLKFSLSIKSRFFLIFLTAFILNGIFLIPISYCSESLSVSAQSAILMEASTQDIIFEKNAYERLPMASTTKIMTALIAIEKYGDMSKSVTVANQAVGVEGSSIYLHQNETLTMEDLVYAVMLESANDAAAAIAYEIAGSIEGFADLMNEKAAEIGLENTHFTNPHGLDNPEHYTTAYDLAKLAVYALENDTFRSIVSTYKKTIPLNGTEGTRLLLNHNKMLKYYDNAIGVKTGFTKKSGRCLVSAADRDGVTVVAVTLNAPDDWNDHRAMLDLGFLSYERLVLADIQSLDLNVPCVGGITEYVRCTNEIPLSVCVKVTSEGTNITQVTEMKRFCYAPVNKGDVLGKVIYYNNGKEIGSVPIVATHDVPEVIVEKNIWQKLSEILFGQ